MQLFLSKSNHLLSFKPDRINLKQRGFRGDGGRRRGGGTTPTSATQNTDRPSGEQVEKQLVVRTRNAGG